MTSFISRDSLTITLGSLELQKLVCVERDASFSEIIEKMNEESIGSIGVIENSKLIGIITEKDFLTKFHRIKECCDSDSEIDITTVMTKNPIVFSEEKDLLAAMKVMTSHDFRHLPIRKGDSLEIISVRDILNIICESFKDDLSKYQPIKHWNKEEPALQEIDILEFPRKGNGISAAVFETPLKRIFNPNFIHIDYAETVEALINKMVSNEVHVAFVMEYETAFIGIITERDLLKKVYSKEIPLNAPTSDLMTPLPDFLSVTHQFGNALKNMQAFDYRNMPIVGQDGYPIGNVTLLDLMGLFYSQLVDLD
ncbi:CBS domain-containing protein [Bacteriovorax sp. Seq25_V]|uniref:CBS domain-containing protein n=1 Tax=Bacteriovorax sp. Seq25_V TaxID=1201288 RepID=UPI000389F1D1|nr:CBS domain-containing protein [Bacteriovorax sp. Seq25_V]EQC43987.1 CBS domain protein [Bacteriovorax sp. Seq25_V]